jgi:NitT/TauT family transport system substrate-binding protein/putative hydroxymethylpyrimidine transport system substrate-binding protein
VPQRRRARWIGLAAAAAFLVGGCGADEEPATRSPTDLSVALDFTPNAVHAPLYMAADRGADRRRGLRVRIRQPGSGPDALKLLAAGRIDVGILDIHDLGLVRERGADIVGIGALVQRPLAALIAQPGVHRPRDLDGRTVGVSGLPSDPAFLRAIVEADGGRYQSIRQVTIGFKAVAALLTRRVDAVPAFWNAEGVALRRRGRQVKEFRVERFGAPAYPEVVFMTTARKLREDPDRLRAFLATVADGIRATQRDPRRATRLVATAARATDSGLIRAQLDAVLPLFSPPLRLDRAILERWADFDARIGILERRPDVDRAFDFTMAP